MEVINNQNFEEEVTTFKVTHNGSKVLLTDMVEDYNEVKTFFENKKEMSYWPSNVHLDLSEGTYDIFITEKHYNKWGKRVKDITIFNELYDYEVNDLGLDNWFNVYTLGIDGGTFIFLSDDSLNYKLGLDIFLEKWMAGEFKGNILKYEENKEIIGFATPTGFGDGIYDISIYKDNDNIVGIYISFINDEDGDTSGLDKSKIEDISISGDSDNDSSSEDYESESYNEDENNEEDEDETISENSKNS
jgi:hypothetical protein